MYQVRYFRGITDITAAITAGTYQTPSLAPGGTFLIAAKVTVNSTATSGSTVSRLLSITPVDELASADVVKFIGKRA